MTLFVWQWLHSIIVCVQKIRFKAFISHVGGVKSGVCGCKQSNVGGVKSELFWILGDFSLIFAHLLQKIGEIYR